MSLDVDARPEGQPGETRTFGRRLIDAYRYGNFVVITLLAFVAAFVVGGLLIAFSDVPTRTSMGYFFSSPGDTFSNGWSAVSGGYSALFRGAIFNTNALYSNGGVPVLGPISETLLNAAPLILGGPKTLWFTPIVYDRFFQAFNWPQGAAYALMLLAACMAFVLIVMRLFKVSLSEIAR